MMIVSYLIMSMLENSLDWKHFKKLMKKYVVKIWTFPKNIRNTFEKSISFSHYRISILPQIWKHINNILGINLRSMYVKISWTNDENQSKDLPVTKKKKRNIIAYCIIWMLEIFLEISLKILEILAEKSWKIWI